MTLPLLLALSISTSALPTPPAPSGDGITLSRTTDGRKATLLGGVELASDWQPSTSPPLRLMDDVRFAWQGAPMALDSGGGVGSEGRQIVALLLGLFVGFGTGHLVARDTNGFILFLIVDIAIIVATGILDAVVWGGFWYIGSAALLISHIVQGLDAYREAGGARLVQLTRQRAVEVASAGSGMDAPPITTRAFSVAF